jgi:hypothetical protein
MTNQGDRPRINHDKRVEVPCSHRHFRPGRHIIFHRGSNNSGSVLPPLPCRLSALRALVACGISHHLTLPRLCDTMALCPILRVDVYWLEVSA